METFLIDRAQGVNLKISVIRGKVMDCYGESHKFNARMNELYVGKTISFLAKDYKQRMLNTYQNVRPESILIHLQTVAAVKQRISDCNGKISMLLKTTYHDADKQKEAQDRIKILRARRQDLQNDYLKFSVKLQDEKDRIATLHDFHMEKVLV